MERYRLHPDASVYFLTYSVVEWLPVFVAEPACRIITDSLAYRRTLLHWPGSVARMVVITGLRS